MTKEERQEQALTLKMQMNLMIAALNNSVDAEDSNKLLSAFQTKLESLEDEIVLTNDLLKDFKDRRKKLNDRILEVNKKQESISDKVYLEKGGKYYRRKINPDKVRIFFEDEEVKQSAPSSQAPRTNINFNKSETTGNKRVKQMVRTPIDDSLIEIPKDVYDVYVSQRESYKAELEELQIELNGVNQNYVAMLDKYKPKKKIVIGKDEDGKDIEKFIRADSQDILDTKFQIDVLKEQIANQEIYLQVYQDNRASYDGIKYSKELKQYMPVSYNKYQDVYGGREPVYEAPSMPEMKTYQPQTRAIPTKKAWWSDTRKKSIDDELLSDFTSGYMFTGIGAPQQRTTQPTMTQPNQPLNTFSKIAPVQQPNVQRDMQSQVKDQLQPKNQNMNPAGFNIKNFIQKYAVPYKIKNQNK
jgi:hypothetical protein